MISINKQKYLAELFNLISFMSDRDRARVMEDLGNRFDECDDEAALVNELGSPTKLAISMARTYVATPEELVETEEDEALPQAEDEKKEEQKEGSSAASAVLNDTSSEDFQASPAPAAPATKARPIGTFFFVLLTIIIGVPIASVLIVIGIPVLAAGLGVTLAAVYLAVTLIGMFTMLSDILLVGGIAAVVGAIGIIIALVGLTISIGLGKLWIGGVLCRLGRVMCRKKIKEELE